MQSSALNPTYTDFSGLNEMRARARVDPQASLEQVAKQFEGIFIQMMLKSMRDASMGDAIFDSDQSKLYQDMFDKQIALDMANSKGIGIADTLIRQLSNNPVENNKPETFTLQKKPHQEMPLPGKNLPLSLHQLNEVDLSTVSGSSKYDLAEIKPAMDRIQFNSPEDFTQYILPYAEKAAKELGVSAHVLVSQAALETGWGKGISRHKDGSSSFSLFNIKADNRWQGDRVIKSTLEYDNGIAKHEKASFRAYDSYANSFDDYVDFLRTNSRYDHALRNKGNDTLFIQGLHKAGYATDPKYSDKVINILKRDFMQVSVTLSASQDKVS